MASPARHAVALPASMDRYDALLEAHFGYPELRPGQQQVLQAIADSDVLAVMPTGGGKSLCYVLPALVTGNVLVVSPLIALMHDQVESLRAVGIPAGAINSSLGRDEQNRLYLDFVRGNLKLLYVAPERLGNERFVRGLREAGVNLLAIDEAHCVSEWGHDFRPDYLMLNHVRQQLGEPRTLALTATAEPRVRGDIARRLGIGDQGSIVVTSVDRPNLTFQVVSMDGDADRKEWLSGYLLQRPNDTGIVYARTRRAVEDLAESLRAAGIDAEGYHAGLPSEERTAIHRRFANDRRRVIVATNAFGLGIDKPDIRFVVHAHMPGRLESYYQEAGRAGRDGEPAECTLLYEQSDARAQQYFIDRAHPNAGQMRDMWERLLGSAEEEFDVRHANRPAGDGVPMMLAALRASGFIDIYGRPIGGGPLTSEVNDYVRRHKHHAEERLARMVAYAHSEQCRRSVILDYFGEQAARPCGVCDNCQSAGRAERDGLWKKLSPFRQRPTGHQHHEPRKASKLRTLEEATAYPTGTRESSLYERLRSWRRERADRDGVPAYVICSNRTLRAIAARRPVDRRALAGVWGLGEARVRRYGGEILAHVAEASRERSWQRYEKRS